VIPPAWRDVRICPWPHGHLQAVGVDDAGRRQYLYHQQWRARRDREKFVRVREFAQRLPAAREQIAHDLQSRGLNQRRVLAAAARLLDVGFFRVGSEQYAQDNGSYGLATVLAGHVDIGRNGALTFTYPAKSGQQRAHSVVDQDVARVLRSLRSRRGQDETLLAYYQAGTWHNVTSDDINAYLREVFGGDVSAKDFRTWHGTVLTAVALATTDQPRASRTAKQRAKVQAIKDVSDYLDNTPAVCRSSYVDPVVL